MKNEEIIINKNTQELRRELLAATIGGTSENNRLGVKATEAFSCYANLAFGGKALIQDLVLVDSKVSLNSITATAKMIFDGKTNDVFLKIHIESGKDNLGVLGDDKEYANAQLLSEANWPVLTPIVKNTDPDYPLLVYPKVSAPTLFSILERSCDKQGAIDPSTLDIFSEMQERIGKATISTLKENSIEKAISAPVQTLFYDRFKVGGRIDQWYEDETLFSLPGLDAPITWSVLKNAKWNINGRFFEKTLSEIVGSARKSLSFEGEKKSYTVTSHGDDHAGNIFVDAGKKQATLFDPAFAGENPIALCDTKALAHIGYVMMGGMYFDSRLETCKYRFDDLSNTIFADVNFISTPIYSVHENMARQIIDSRIIPLFQKAAEMGAILPLEFQRFRDALSGCPLLTVNIPKLLDAKDGRGAGLLPLAVMMNDMRGFNSLEYLGAQLEKLTK